MTKSLPSFDSSVGPECERYFRAEDLSRRLMQQRDKNSVEHRELLDRNPVLQNQLNRENFSHPKKEPTFADRMLAEAEGVGDPQSQEAKPPESALDMERYAMHRSRELGADWQNLTEALLQLGDKQIVWHSRACREYCAKIRDEAYAPIARDVAQAILALAHAVDRHDAFTAELHAMQVTQRSNLMLLELPQWRHLLRQLNSAVEHGYLSAREIKPEWRTK